MTQSSTVRDLLTLFNRAVRTAPNAPAVDHEDGRLSYEELDQASDLLSRDLIAKGVRSGNPVILVTAHGTRNVVALLAILKAGACYVPIDRGTWSRQRTDDVISRVTDCSLIINTTPEPFECKTHEVLHVTDARQPNRVRQNLPSATPTASPEDAACIIFTSGSTGRPKGVVLTHHGIANYAKTSPFNMDIAAGDRVLHILSVAFDASTGMLFSILGNAGTVVPSSMEKLHDHATTCTVLASTPSILASLVLPSKERNPYPHVHTVLLGGETPPLDILRGWLGVGKRILNAYGPTEATTASTMQVFLPEHCNNEIRNNIIGAPMSQCPVYLLDLEDNEIQENDNDGEIVISGCSLARGYYKDPERTGTSFVTWQGMRVYRTGDVARWTQARDGSRVLEFRGRRDRIVKNRGFLVNLEADIEVAIQRLGLGVEGIFATIYQGMLVALMTPGTLDSDIVRENIAKNLSSFHTPDIVHVVETLPLSANGKIDPRQVQSMLSRAMPEVDQEEASSPESDAPEDVKSTIFQCMAAVLNIPTSQLDKDADFFQCGGNSLAALKLASLCYTKGIHLSPRDVYQNRSPQRIAKCAMAAQTDSGYSSLASLTSQPVPRKPIDDRKGIPLTPQQLELCLPTVECPSKNCNQLRKRYTHADAPAVMAAWRSVWESEPCARHAISLDEELGMQSIAASPIYNIVECAFQSECEYHSAVESASLEVGIGMRLDFFQYSPGETRGHDGELSVVWTAHHALIDGYSLALVLAQVERALEGLPLVSSPPFDTAAIDLVALQDQRDHEAREFWAEYLSDIGPDHQWSTKHTASSEHSPLARELTFDVEDRYEALQGLSKQYGATLASVYYTAWALALAGRKRSLNVQVGAVYSGRQALLDHVDAIGQLMNTLPLIVRLDPAATIQDQLHNVMLDLARCAEFSWSAPRQVGHRVDNLLASQFDFPAYKETVPACSTTFFENSDFPLSLLAESDGHFRLLFDQKRYSEESMQALSEDFASALIDLLEHDKMSQVLGSISQEPVDGCSEALKTDDNDESNCGKQRSSAATLASSFETSVASYADMAAVEGPDLHWTYKELDDAASCVGCAIQQLGLTTDTVAIYADGSVYWIAGVLGILKAGYAYCPIDPSYQSERQASVYKQSGAGAIVFPSPEHARQVSSDLHDAANVVVASTVQNCPGKCRRAPVDPSSDALIVFTSGTTGEPKGVPISHRGLLALQSNPEATMFSHPGLRIAQYMSPAFDYCANEIFSALLHGATLVLKDPCDPNDHLKRVDAVTITPSVLGVLDPSDYSNLRTVYATGEPVPPALVNAWAPGRSFYNAYGPAECSICTSFTPLVPGQLVTIGRPISTARMYVLDDQLHPCKPGEEGEIFLAGIQVMRGYIGADEESRRKVLPDPWHAKSTMYRTGDYGKWTDDGDLFYIGRIDRQVKVRGYRVELAAIEQKIYDLDPNVKLAAALVANDTLMAFVKPDTIDVDCLRLRLGKSLQPSWVPQLVYALKEFPMTPNRKVDLRELQRVGLSRGRDCADVSLRDELENTIAQEWKHVLKLSSDFHLSRESDFMQLGGNSVLQMLLAVRLTKKLGVSLSVRQVISAPLLRQQSEIVRQQQTHLVDNSGTVASSLKAHQPSYLEQQAWFQYSVGTSTTTFNIPVLLKLGGRFDRAKLVRCLNQALATRTVLRSNFMNGACGPRRVVRPKAPKVRLCKADALDFQSEISRAFDLTQDELIRVFFCRDTLLVIACHAICDLNSVQALLRQASKAYKDEDIGESRFEYLKSDVWSYNVRQEDKQYWSSALRDLSPSINLDLSPSTAIFEGSSARKLFKGPLISNLSTLMKRHAVTQHQLVSTAVAQTLQWITKTDDVVLGCPYENRHSEKDRESVGLFLDRLPLRFKSSATSTCAELLTAARDVTQQALRYAIPFHELMALLNLPPTLEQHPIFQTMVTFHLRGATEGSLQVPECEVSRQECFPPGAKFLLMFEWTELEDDLWELRIEYDSTRLSAQTITTFQQALEIVLESMASELSRKEMQKKLSQKLPKSKQQSRSSLPADNMIYCIRREMAACLEIDMRKLPCTVSFFEAGGNSMGAVNLQRRMKKIGLEVGIRTIFEMATAERLAGHLLTF